MDKNPNRLTKDQLFELDIFFKNQYNARPRYGRMGYFYWKIFRNPISQGFVNLIQEDNVIAPSTSITPKTLCYNKLEIPSAEIGDTYTDIKYRGKGLFSLLINQSREEANKDGIEFIYGTPNSNSLPGYEKRANFKVLDSLDVISLKFPLSIKSSLRNRMTWFLSDWIDLIFQIIIRCYSFVLSSRSIRSSKFTIEEINEMPHDWDEFWNLAIDDWDFIFSRNSKQMTWRYMDHPDVYNFLLLRFNGQLVGYMVYKELDTESGKNFLIADFLTLKEYSNSVMNGIKHLRVKSLKKGASSIITWCDSKSPFFRIFKKNGFIGTSKVPVIAYVDGLFEKLRSIKNVHFTLGDSDNI